jgi:hypothetical protein
VKRNARQDLGELPCGQSFFMEVGFGECCSGDALAPKRSRLGRTNQSRMFVSEHGKDFDLDLTRARWANRIVKVQ